MMVNKKLTLKVTKLAFYNGALVYPNEIIKNFKDDKVPSWATLAGGKEIKPDEKTPDEPQNPVNPEEKGNKDPENETKTGPDEKTPDDDAPINSKTEKSEVELQEELDALLDESVSKGIILENAEKKTLVEQIAELKVLLCK